MNTSTGFACKVCHGRSVKRIMWKLGKCLILDVINRV